MFQIHLKNVNNWLLICWAKAWQFLIDFGSWTLCQAVCRAFSGINLQFLLVKRGFIYRKNASTKYDLKLSIFKFVYSRILNHLQLYLSPVGFFCCKKEKHTLFITSNLWGILGTLWEVLQVLDFHYLLIVTERTFEAPQC